MAAIAIAREAEWFVLRAETRLGRPLDEVFPFFADAANLEALTPPFLGFHIVTPQPIAMHVGARIEYRLRVHGVPLRWRSLISAWDPPRRFVDEQTAGPYRRWVHEHTFEADATATICRDVVRYQLWAPPGVGGLVNRMLVAPDLIRIFTFRADQLRRRFGS